MPGFGIAAVVLSLLVLGAHFLRAGSPFLMLAALVALGLLFVRRPWAVRAVQMALVLGSLEWVRTLVRLAEERMQAGEPVTRMVAILGGVAAFTLCSGLVLSLGPARRFYGLHRQPSAPEDA